MEWRQICNHAHQEECQSCNILRMTFVELHGIVTENKLISNDIRSRFIYRIKQSQAFIEEWKRHQIRSVHQATALEKVLDELDDSSVLLISDWAMKFLPQRYREAQREFFGKRGMPWHLIYAVRRRSNTNSLSASSATLSKSLEHQTYCHIFDQCTQNSRSVVSVIADVLKRLKSINPNLKTAFFRSDNAACYHSTTTLLAVEEILKETGVFIKRVDFSDPQSGKCACDRMAAVTKANVRRYINERHDCCNAAQFVEAAKATKYMSFFDSRLLDCIDEKSTPTWEGIKSYNNLEYQIISTSRIKTGKPRSTDVQVTVWRAFNIGQGKKFLFSKLKPPENSISTIQTGAEHVNTQWKEDFIEKEYGTGDDDDDDSIDKNTTFVSNGTAMEIDSPSNEQFVTFDCPDPQCIRQFRRESNLLAHLIYENHKYPPMKKHLLDQAGMMYKQRLENDQRINPPILNNFVIISSSSPSALDPLPEGWALFRPKPRKSFTQKQIAFLIDKYNHGEQMGGKWDPAAVAHEMQIAKHQDRFIFEPDEFLSNSQIKSYFSRVTKQRRKQTTNSQSTLSSNESTQHTTVVNDEDDQQTIDEDENEFDSIVATNHVVSVLNSPIQFLNNNATTHNETSD